MEKLNLLLLKWRYLATIQGLVYYNTYQEYLIAKNLLDAILKEISEVRDRRISEHLAGLRGCPTLPYEEITLEVIKVSWYHTPFLKVTAYLPSRPKNDKVIKYPIG